MASTTSPNVKAMPACVMAPLLVSLITMAPVPAKTRANVPNASATYFYIENELPRGGGESKEEPALNPVSDGERRGQSCIFFESVLAKKVRADPNAAVTNHYLRSKKLLNFAQHFDEPIDLRGRIVKIKTRARGGLDAEPVHQRLIAV